ncbi:unnamed protein product [Miscanthus lutarioriparius]|uniref:Uncharacterized protein n=1 Tax=Miscanthus lutarioriparius TaxID=422564 RepID=A0A811NLV3_9POAL|nr:unnamed protein product [Miscanthus lutarioriparius]
MASRSSARFYLLLRFSGGGGSVGATFSVGRRSFLFLLGPSVEDFVDVIFFGEPEARSGLLINGLDFFSVRTLLGIFCFLHAFSGVYVRGDRCLAVAIGRLEHDGVLCGPLSTDDVLLMLSSASVFESAVNLSAPEVPALSIIQSSSLREMEKAWLAAIVVDSGKDRWVLLAWISM